MREISPVENLSADNFLKLAGPEAEKVASAIRSEKRTGTRPHPSSTLIDRSRLLTPSERHRLLDKVAGLVDENLFGRSEMCIQFADLLQRALAHLDLPARSVVGQATYYSDGDEVFRWEHAWVRIGGEVIDGNVDSLFENPMVPSEVSAVPYWGPIEETPRDRKLREFHKRKLSPEKDVSAIWWPDLRMWLDEELKNQVNQESDSDAASRAP